MLKTLFSLSERNTAEWRSDRFKILNLFILLSLLQIPLFVFVYGTAGSHLLSGIILFAAVPIGLTYPIGKITGSTVWAGNWLVGSGFILFLILACFSGGLTAPSLTWSISIPIVATLICGSRSGVIWFFLVVLKISLFYAAEKMGYSMVREYLETGHRAVHYFTLIGITILSLFLAMVTEYYRNRYLVRIEKANQDLREALENVKTLSGMLPMCAWCKKVRDDQGYWDGVEKYIEKHSDASFSHGICPKCHAKQRELLKEQ